VTLTAPTTLERVGGGDLGPSAEPVASTIADLVTAIERDDGQALFGFALRLGLPDAEADDAVQETLVRVYLELRRGVTLLNPRAWAFRACYRVCMDHHRRSRRQRSALERVEVPSPAQSGAEMDDTKAVWEEVDRLPPRQRQVLYLRYAADMTFEDVGTTLAISASAARSHDTQARASLRRTLDSGKR
jgi:RNA polymerase sigma factor (sigma-70 family)